MTLNGGSCVWQATASSPRWAVSIAYGSAVKAILETAQVQNVGLVAMSSHGLNALPRQFYGSTTAGVLQQIDQPLLLIRSRTV